jgi:hypothetical protein
MAKENHCRTSSEYCQANYMDRTPAFAYISLPSKIFMFPVYWKKHNMT